MRVQTLTAVLIPVGKIRKLPSAAIPQHIKRTIAEQAVEIIPVRPFVAGKILAFFMWIIRILFCHLSFLLLALKKRIPRREHASKRISQNSHLMEACFRFRQKHHFLPACLTYPDKRLHSDRLAGIFTQFRVPFRWIEENIFSIVFRFFIIAQGWFRCT